MADIGKISKLIDGFPRTVDLSTNTVVVGDLKVGGPSGTLLSQQGDFAFFTGTISGTATPVTITADHPGAAGNSVALIFNGSNSVSDAINTWNLANPSDQVSLTSGNGTQIPSPQTVNLSDGIDAGSTLVGDTATYENFTPTDPTVAGALAGIDAALVFSGSTQKVDKFTLDSTDESNKYVTLSFTPSVLGDTILLVEDAGNMFFGVDFTVTGNQLGWSGMALDGILSAGDNLTVTYSI